MRDRGTRSTGVPPGTGTGLLLVVGFSGSPPAVTKAVRDCEHVQDVTARRSGSQIELTVELTHTATVSRLRKIVEQLKDFDATIHGMQRVPVPTLVFSLAPAKTLQHRFLHRSPSQRSGDRRSSPQIPPPQGEIAVAGPIPVQIPAPVVAGPTPVTRQPESEVATPETPGPVATLARSAGHAMVRSVATELRQAASVLGRTIIAVSLFTGRLLVQLISGTARQVARFFTSLPGVIFRISRIITTAGNALFGTDPDDEVDAGRPGSKDVSNE